MFNIPLYQYQIQNWQEKKQKLLEICSTIDFKNQDIGNRKITSINSDNVYTDYRSGNDDIYREDVKKILENELHNFKKDAKLDIMNVGEVWFQQYYKTQFHSPHNHGACGYSSVTYIKFNKDMRFNIIIRSILNYKNTSEISAASGVVLDSAAKKEFNENFIKAKSLLELYK